MAAIILKLSIPLLSDQCSFDSEEIKYDVDGDIDALHIIQ